MSQYDFGTIDPNVMSGTQLAIALNEFRDALHTQHRGETRPTYVQGGMLWIRETSAERWDAMFFDGNTDVLLFSVNPSSGALVNHEISATEPAITYALQRWWDVSGASPLLRLRSSDNAAWHTQGAIVAGQWVPYSAGESADQRYARLLGSNDFSEIPTVNGAPFITTTAFFKGDAARAAWTTSGSAPLETASAIDLAVGATLVQIPAATPITLPTLTNGTDYFIYAFADGSLEAVPADDAAPTESRLVGGFHAFDAGDGIAERSLWDLNWRPKCNPRAMVLSPDNRVWADIYLMDVEYGLHGYSRLGQQIADDGDRPIMPEMYGGDGVATYGSMSWWVAVDLATAAGKRLPLYPEFTAFAYGVVERQAVGTDPGTTQHQAGHRSACGVEQVTGVMWQWGADVAATAGSSWSNIAEGRGDVYANNLKAVLLGANWASAGNAGSRASYWSGAPSHSVASFSARAVCDHLNLQVAA